MTTNEESLETEAVSQTQNENRLQFVQQPPLKSVYSGIIADVGYNWIRFRRRLKLLKEIQEKKQSNASQDVFETRVLDLSQRKARTGEIVAASTSQRSFERALRRSATVDWKTELEMPVSAALVVLILLSVSGVYGYWRDQGMVRLFEYQPSRIMIEWQKISSTANGSFPMVEVSLQRLQTEESNDAIETAGSLRLYGESENTGEDETHSPIAEFHRGQGYLETIRNRDGKLSPTAVDLEPLQSAITCKFSQKFRGDSEVLVIAQGDHRQQSGFRLM